MLLTALIFSTVGFAVLGFVLAAAFMTGNKLRWPLLLVAVLGGVSIAIRLIHFLF